MNTYTSTAAHRKPISEYSGEFSYLRNNFFIYPWIKSVITTTGNLLDLPGQAKSVTGLILCHGHQWQLRITQAKTVWMCFPRPSYSVLHSQDLFHSLSTVRITEREVQVQSRCAPWNPAAVYGEALPALSLNCRNINLSSICFKNIIIRYSVITTI